MSDTAPFSARDRPPGLAPKGTSWGLALGVFYAAFVPMLTALCLSPWFAGGVITGLSIALLIVPVWAIVAIPTIIGFKSRRYWGVVAFFCVGAFSAVALPLALAAVGLALVTTVGRWPPQVYLLEFYGPCLLVAGAFWPLLIRALRLRYWQPWTTPDQWETGDERIAGWVYKAAGASRPRR